MSTSIRKGKIRSYTVREEWFGIGESEHDRYRVTFREDTPYMLVEYVAEPDGVYQKGATILVTAEWEKALVAIQRHYYGMKAMKPKGWKG